MVDFSTLKPRVDVTMNATSDYDVNVYRQRTHMYMYSTEYEFLQGYFLFFFYSPCSIA